MATLITGFWFWETSVQSAKHGCTPTSHRAIHNLYIGRHTDMFRVRLGRRPSPELPLLSKGSRAAVSCLILMLVALAPAHGTETRLLGIQPFLSAPALFERYAPLRDWLAEQLGVPVRIESARTRDVFHGRIWTERYDLVFTSPHVVPFLIEETNYRAVAATRDRLAILVAVIPEARFNRIEDLANSKIAAPFEESLAAAFLNHMLSNLVWPDGSSPPTVRHHHHHSGAITTFLRGEAEALVLVTDGDLIDDQRRDESAQTLMSLHDGTLVRIISQSPSFPGMTLLAREEVLAGLPDLEDQLIRMQDTPHGLEVLRAIRHRGFVAIEETDYRPFRQSAFGRELPSLGDAKNDQGKH